MYEVKLVPMWFSSNLKHVHSVCFLTCQLEVERDVFIVCCSCEAGENLYKTLCIFCGVVKIVINGVFPSNFGRKQRVSLAVKPLAVGHFDGGSLTLLGFLIRQID